MFEHSPLRLYLALDYILPENLSERNFSSLVLVTLLGIHLALVLRCVIGLCFENFLQSCSGRPPTTQAQHLAALTGMVEYLMAMMAATVELAAGSES